MLSPKLTEYDAVEMVKVEENGEVIMRTDGTYHLGLKDGYV